MCPASLEVVLRAPVVAVLHACCQHGAGDGCASGGNSQQVGFLQPSEHGFPLLGGLLILQVELRQIDRRGRSRLCETVAFFGAERSPLAFLGPFLGQSVHFLRITVGVRLSRRAYERHHGQHQCENSFLHGVKVFEKFIIPVSATKIRLSFGIPKGFGQKEVHYPPFLMA